MPLALFWLPFLTAILIGSLVAPLAIKLAWKLHLVDDPSIHLHQKVVHTYPVPRGGGLIILPAIIIPSLLWLPIDNHLVGILTGAILACVIGLLDDRYDISPYIRLLTNIFCAGAVVAAGIGIAYFNSPFGGIIDASWPRLVISAGNWSGSIWFLSDVFAVVWIVSMMNLLGQGAGGIEGQLPGVIVIAAIYIALLSLRFSADITQWPVITLAAITAGAYLSFLPWNFFPQKIMPGYSGKSLGGFMLAVLALLSTTKVGLVLVVLGIPIIDTLWTYLRRIWNRKSPLWGDRGHLHHKLLDAGMTKPQIVLLYWAATASLGWIALNLNSRQKLYVFFTISLAIGVGLLILTSLIARKPVKK